MITITQLPIAFHCRSCKENFRKESLGSYPAKCPSCGEDRTSYGYLKLPQHHFWKHEPAKYFITSNEKQCKFEFVSMNGGRCEFLVDVGEYHNFEFEMDNYVGQVKSILESNIFEWYGDKAKLQTFYDSSILPFEKEHKINYTKNKIEECLIEMYEMNKKLNDYGCDLEELTEEQL